MKPKAASGSEAPKRPPLTDEERHHRFVETAREIGADENSEAFDRAFSNVVSPPKPKD